MDELNSRIGDDEDELPIIQKTYDLILWYVPILNRLPKTHKYNLGDRIISELYDFLDGLVDAKYKKDKLTRLQSLNVRLHLLRLQTRLLFHFKVVDERRWEAAGKMMKEIGQDLGGWINQQRRKFT
jgi:hypothetical protein